VRLHLFGCDCATGGSILASLGSFQTQLLQLLLYSYLLLLLLLHVCLFCWL
jgi:hypothetical protein